MATSPEPNVKAERRWSSSSFSRSSTRSAVPTRHSSSSSDQSQKPSGPSSLRAALGKLGIVNYISKPKPVRAPRSESTLVGSEASILEEGLKDSLSDVNDKLEGARSESPFASSPLQTESPSTSLPYDRRKGIRKNTGAAFEGGFQGVLQVLGKAPIPGIEMVTNGLAEVISRATQLDHNKRALDQLEARFEQINAMLEAIEESISDRPMFEKYGKRIRDALQELSFEIQRHANRGTLSKFFGSIVDNEELQYHIRVLDSLMTEIGTAVGLQTNNQVREIYKKLLSLQAAENKEAGRGEQSIDLENAHIDTPGLIFAHNRGHIKMNLTGAYIKAGGHIGVGNDSTWDSGKAMELQMQHARAQYAGIGPGPAMDYGYGYGYAHALEAPLYRSPIEAPGYGHPLEGPGYRSAIEGPRYRTEGPRHRSATEGPEYRPIITAPGYRSAIGAPGRSMALEAPPARRSHTTPLQTGA